MVSFERLHFGYTTHLGGNVHNAVVTGIPGNDHRPGKADGTQQLLIGDILDKDDGIRLQHRAEEPAIPLKKYMLRHEGRGNQKHGYPIFFQHAEVMMPEFIFNKEHTAGSDQLQEIPGIGRSVFGKVTHVIGQLVMLSDFITGRGKKSQQDFVPGKISFQSFDEWTGLFKLAQRSDMDPDPLLTWFQQVAQPVAPAAPAPGPLRGFDIPQGCQAKYQALQQNEKIIQEEGQSN